MAGVEGGGMGMAWPSITGTRDLGEHRSLAKDDGSAGFAVRQMKYWGQEAAARERKENEAKFDAYHAELKARQKDLPADQKMTEQQFQDGLTALSTPTPATGSACNCGASASGDEDQRRHSADCQTYTPATGSGGDVEEGCTPTDAKVLRKANHALAGENDTYRQALEFYADRQHFNIADTDAWDTVSGEPPNYWCDEAGTATVEDGHVARHALEHPTPAGGDAGGGL